MESKDTMKYNGRPTANNESCTETELCVYDFLDKLEIDYTTYCHRPAFTMEECAEVRKESGAPVFKNLFLTNKQQTQFYLLMLPADKPFKTKHLSPQLGCARLSFASAEMMERHLHVHPGAVSPLGLIFDTGKHVKLIIDRDLDGNSDRYACHPCVNTASVVINLRDLLDTIIPATGHDFTWVDLKPE